MSNRKQIEITLTQTVGGVDYPVTYTVDYTVYPPSPGVVERGLGTPLTPDEPGSIEIEDIMVGRHGKLQSVTVTDEIEAQLYEILYAYSELNQDI